MGAICSKAVTLLVGVLYPAYMTWKAVHAHHHLQRQWQQRQRALHSSPSSRRGSAASPAPSGPAAGRQSSDGDASAEWDLERSAVYWTVMAAWRALEHFGDALVGWFPGYHWWKIAVIWWLQSDRTNGAAWVYRRYLSPLLRRYAQVIDHVAAAARLRARRAASEAATAAEEAALVWAEQVRSGLRQAVGYAIRLATDPPKRRKSGSMADSGARAASPAADEGLCGAAGDVGGGAARVEPLDFPELDTLLASGVEDSADEDGQISEDDNSAGQLRHAPPAASPTRERALHSPEVQLSSPAGSMHCSGRRRSTLSQSAQRLRASAAEAASAAAAAVRDSDASHPLSAEEARGAESESGGFSEDEYSEGVDEDDLISEHFSDFEVDVAECGGSFDNDSDVEAEADWGARANAVALAHAARMSPPTVRTLRRGAVRHTAAPVPASAPPAPARSVLSQLQVPVQQPLVHAKGVAKSRNHPSLRKMQSAATTVPPASPPPAFAL